MAHLKGLKGELGHHDSQHNGIQHNDIQQKDAQQNDIQHNDLSITTFSRIINKTRHSA